MKIEGVNLRRVSRDWIARLAAGPLPDWCYELTWTPQSLAAAAVEETAVALGRWLIFDSPDGTGGALAERLRMKGHECVLVPADIAAEGRGHAVEEFLGGQGLPARGVVYLAGLGTESNRQTPDFAAARRDGWGAALDIVHALTISAKAKPPRLWLVTRGAHAAGNETPLALEQSPLWGLGRVIAAEHPELECSRIDLEPYVSLSSLTSKRDQAGKPDVHQNTASAEADQLAEEIWSGQPEDQLAYRDGERLVARLRRLDEAEPGTLQVPRGRPYRLEITARGQLDNVALQPVNRQTPGPGQVEIKVRATGLNFRDVLNVLNLYPGDPGPLGGECAGEIVAVGPDVRAVQAGRCRYRFGPGEFCQPCDYARRFRRAEAGTPQL